MARPQKNNADYFPHNNDMRNDRRCKALRSKFNLEGYAVFIMLLETLTGANHFQIENNKMELELIAGDIDIDSKKLNAILEYLIKLGLLVREKDLISSPMLNDLKKILNEVREKDRRRKINPTENPIKENTLKENTVFQSENNFIHLENTQSKVKERKVNKRKGNESKEKGNSKISSPDFSNHFSFSENNNLATGITSSVEVPESNSPKKSCAKKSFSNELMQVCKQRFEAVAPQYVWETKDHEQLIFLLQKISITKPDLSSDVDISNAFVSFIQNLPEYWRTKKFTIPNLNYNYNEIVSEIRAKNSLSKTKKITVSKPMQAQTLEPKRELSEVEKTEQRKSFIRSICECYEKFVDTGQHGLLPLWVMYDTLVDEHVLKLPDKKIQAYREQAIAERKTELSKPKHQHEARNFNAILENFETEITQGNEKHKLDIAVKILAVKGLFEELKHKQIDIKKLFKH